MHWLDETHNDTIQIVRKEVPQNLMLSSDLVTGLDSATRGRILFGHPFAESVLFQGGGLTIAITRIICTDRTIGSSTVTVIST